MQWKGGDSNEVEESGGTSLIEACMDDCDVNQIIDRERGKQRQRSGWDSSEVEK